MEFFNKKEEVIDLQLTQYGRFLLSQGKFKPTYYAFYDENILYNSERADITETQNESEERIKTTPVMHPQVGFSSLEREFQNNYNLVLSGKKDPSDSSLQRTPERFYLLPQSLGTSDINSEYSPSWSVIFLNGTLSGSVDHSVKREKSGGVNIQKIPQLSSQTTIEITSVTEGDFEYDEALDGPLASEYGIITDEEDTYVMLKVIENNGLYQKKNFDIELFEVYEESKPSVAASVTLTAKSWASGVSEGLTLRIDSRSLCNTSIDGCASTVVFRVGTTTNNYTLDVDNCQTPEGLITELKTVLDLSIASTLGPGVTTYITTSEVTDDSAGNPRVLTLTQNWPGSLANFGISGTLLNTARLIANNTTYGNTTHGELAFTGGSETTTETLRPLNFSKPYEIENELTFMGSHEPKNDQDHVEYYFEVRVDEEIADQVLCRLDPEDINKKLGVHADERTIACQEELDRKKKKAVGDIYVREGAPPNSSVGPGGASGATAGSGKGRPGDSDNPGEIC